MKRRQFGKALLYTSAGFGYVPWSYSRKSIFSGIKADLVVVGGGLGGCAAALAAVRNGRKVVLVEETDWLGGQISQQGVPPDEHQWIETHGAPLSYRTYREKIRDYYRSNYPLTDMARSTANLNPGNGAVSRLCCEPLVAERVLSDLLIPYVSRGLLTILRQNRAVQAEVVGDRVVSLIVRDMVAGNEHVLEAPYFIDATELGDLLPMTGTEYVTGSESRSQTGELHAHDKADPQNMQAFTMCFAMDYVEGQRFEMEEPDDYSFWKNYVPDLDPPWAGKLLELNYSNPRNLQPKDLGFDPSGSPTGDHLNLWNYRRIIHKENFVTGTYSGDITVVNWPQNDYMEGSLVDVSQEEFEKHIHASKQLSLSLFYWLLTEAPRPDGGMGWPGLRLRKDVMGTVDGLAKYPYVRESRRMKTRFTVLEEHVGKENRKLVSGEDTAAVFDDSVGVGYYHIDLHPSCGGNNYIDFPSLPFQIPLGALVPQRMRNLLPGNKNIGTTHITNGCYRLHPVEWSIGESVGLLSAFCLERNETPQSVYEQKDILGDFQELLRNQGVETHWKH